MRIPTIAAACCCLILAGCAGPAKKKAGRPFPAVAEDILWKAAEGKGRLRMRVKGAPLRRTLWQHGGKEYLVVLSREEGDIGDGFDVLVYDRSYKVVRRVG